MQLCEYFTPFNLLLIRHLIVVGRYRCLVLPQASPSKKFHPSRPMISFCTAVVVEALGSVISVDNDVVTRILPFVNSGLQSDAKGGPDHKVRFKASLLSVTTQPDAFNDFYVLHMTFWVF